MSDSKLTENNEPITNYLTELSILSNRRVELVRIIHLWYQIMIPASFIVIMNSIKFSGQGQLILRPLCAGVFFANLVLIFCRVISGYFDRRVIDLYSRIAAIENYYGFSTFKNYSLEKTINKEGLNNVFNAISETKQKIDENQKKLMVELNFKNFPMERRGFRPLFFMLKFLVGTFSFLPILFSIPLSIPILEGPLIRGAIGSAVLLGISWYFWTNQESHFQD